MPALSLFDIANHLGGRCTHSENTLIQGMSSFDSGVAGTLVFVNQEKLLPTLSDSQAAAVIIKPQWAERVSLPAILVDDPYLAYAQASQLFAVRPPHLAGIHTSAVIDSTASLGQNVEIAAGVVIAAGVDIADDCYIGPNTVIGAHSTIGQGTRLFANVSVYHNVEIGAACEVSSGAVIGADGFGFAPSSEGWQAIAQNGGVILGTGVYIGANTTIDRGAIDATRIGNGVIIDNLVQLAHNVVVGENTAIAAGALVAGSTTIGKNCMIAGGAGLVGHIEVCDNVTVSARTRVTKSIKEPGVYASGTPFMKVKDWRKAAALFARSAKNKK